MSDIHDRQRNAAHADIIGSGGWLIQTTVDLQINLFEDSNVYSIDIDSGGPAIHFWVNGWHCDWWPFLTYERALHQAGRI